MSSLGSSIEPSADSQRNIAFASIFDLPNEDLIDDFTCALLKGFVWVFQGRMFLSRGHICFYSAMLSSGDKNLIISIDDVAEITKKNTAWIVPNAIQIVMKDGTEYFFVSFLSRNRCFDLLQKVLCKEPLHPVVSSSSEPILKRASSSPSPLHFPRSPSSCSPASQESSEASSPIAEGRPPLPYSPPPDVPGPILPNEDACPVRSEPDEGIVAVPPALGEQCCSGTLQDLDNSLCETLWGTPGLAFKEIGRLQIPVPTRQIFSRFFAHSATTFPFSRYLEQIGASEINLHPWKSVNGISIQSISMTMPITNPLAGVKSTRIEELNYCIWDETTRSFHYRSQSKSLDVPYGDCFQPLIAYDIIPSTDDMSDVVARACIFFTKNAWGFRSIIARQAIDGIKSSFSIWSKGVLMTLTAMDQPPADVVPAATIPLKRAPNRTIKFGNQLFSSYGHAILALFLAVLIAILMSMMALRLSWPEESYDSLCLAIPDLMMSLHNSEQLLRDLALAEQYCRALALRLDRLGGSTLEPVDSDMAAINQILDEWIESEKRFAHPDLMSVEHGLQHLI